MDLWDVLGYWRMCRMVLSVWVAVADWADGVDALNLSPGTVGTGYGGR